MTGPGVDHRLGTPPVGSRAIVAAATRTVRAVVLFALLLPDTLAAQDPRQVALLRGQIGIDPEPGSLLATPARLTVSGLPLPEALSRLAERSRVQIAFSPTLLPARHNVDCDCATLNTARALDRLLAGTDLGYAELGSQIVVVPLAPPEPPPLNGTIRGRVRTEVAFPMEDATAHLVAAADSTAHRVTMSDRLGFFAFHDLLPGDYVLTVGRIGYAPLEEEITLGSGTVAHVDLELTEQPVALEEVQVDVLGTRHRARFRQSAGETVQEIDRAQLRLIPGVAEPDPMRTLDALPGVTRLSDIGASFHVRGGSSDQNLVLLDGVPIFNPFHSLGLFSVFSADMVRRTELRSGGFPAEFGGRASSVLLVESDLGDGKFGVDAGMTLLTARVSVAGGLPEITREKFGLASVRWRIGARRSYVDALTRPFLSAPFPYYLQDRQAGFEVWTKGGSRLRLTTYSGRDVANLTDIERLDERNPEVLPDQDVKWRWGNKAIGIAWTRPRSGGGALDVHVSYSGFEGDFNLSEFPAPHLTTAIHSFSLGTDLEHRPGSRIRRKSGFLLRYLDYSGESRGKPSTLLPTDASSGLGAGAYTQVDWTPSRRWLVEGGLRLDLWESRGGGSKAVSPRVAVKHFLQHGRWAVHASAGKYVQLLQSVRDESLPIAIDPWVLAGGEGGEWIPPVVSRQFQGGVEGFLDDDDEWFASAEAYHRNYDGLATRNWGEDPWIPDDDVLIGTGRSFGADVVLRKNRGPTTGWVSLSLLKATRRFPESGSGLETGSMIEYPPDFDRRVEVDVVAQRRLPWDVDAGLRWSFGTGLPHTRLVPYQIPRQQIIDLGLAEGEEDVVWLGPRNGERYPVRHRLDISLRKVVRKRWGLITPYLNLINVYNRKNVVQYLYGRRYTSFGGSNAVRGRRGIALVPFLPTFGVEVSF